VLFRVSLQCLADAATIISYRRPATHGRAATLMDSNNPN
jgi:hypothetical protein